ncbi:hypothetical protein ID866_7705 [Astraeus odoratus]|nr:hypothetical protein ID866_7705 [Astraeus odoratus]
MPASSITVLAITRKHMKQARHSPSQARFIFTILDLKSLILALLTNTGDCVTLFGATGPQNGQYSVQLDGGQVTTYNGTTFRSYYGVTLFHADNLGSGQHQMVITNLPTTSGEQLAIDYAMVSYLTR